MHERTAAGAESLRASEAVRLRIFEAVIATSTCARCWSVDLVSITAADVAHHNENAGYINLVTPANPTGEQRGQMTAGAPMSPHAPKFSPLQATIFTPICSLCHPGGGSSLPSSMNLSSTAETYAALVNVPRVEQPSVKRVTPGDPIGSYVIKRLEGAPSLSGPHIPFGGPSLDEAPIYTVKSWITAGA
jgi:hypothetical protein